MPGNDVHGGFATHVMVPARGLCVVDEPGALTGARIARSGATLAELAVVADAVATPYQAVRRACVGAGDLVLVVGLGGVGGFAAQIAHALGATVIGFDPVPERRELLAVHGLDLALDPGEKDGRALREECRRFARVRELPASRWKIFECSGTPAGQDLAWSLLGPGAYLSVVGYTVERIEVRLSNLMAFDAKVVGNWGCVPGLYPAALQLVLSGVVAIAPFVETYPLEEIEAVFTAVREHRTTRRPVLVPPPAEV
jgi:6-hydroxycyclohex-1-ene-1-carbonyl-CoA dehydrogenase